MTYEYAHYVDGSQQAIDTILNLLRERNDLRRRLLTLLVALGPQDIDIGYATHVVLNESKFELVIDDDGRGKTHYAAKLPAKDIDASRAVE